MGAEWFNSEWRERVEKRRTRLAQFPTPSRSSTSYGYVYLMAHSELGLLKVGFTTRRSDFSVGRIAQHIDQGFTKLKVVRFETVEEARLLESDVLWLWSEHNVRRKLTTSEMPQGGGTEVAVDSPLSRSLFTRAVSAKQRGEDPRMTLAPRSSENKNQSPLPTPIPRIRSILVGTVIVGTSHYSSSERVREQQGSLVDGWVIQNLNNTFDRNALEVHTSYGMIGHVPAKIAATLAPLIRQLNDGLSIKVRVPVNGQGGLKIENVQKRSV
jgi:hypothetical protein